MEVVTLVEQFQAGIENQAGHLRIDHHGSRRDLAPQRHYPVREFAMEVQYLFWAALNLRARQRLRPSCRPASS